MVEGRGHGSQAQQKGQGAPDLEPINPLEIIVGPQRAQEGELPQADAQRCGKLLRGDGTAAQLEVVALAREQPDLDVLWVEQQVRVARDNVGALTLPLVPQLEAGPRRGPRGKRCVRPPLAASA